jgi:hypothetical protein
MIVPAAGAAGARAFEVVAPTALRIRPKPAEPLSLLRPEFYIGNVNAVGV